MTSYTGPLKVVYYCEKFFKKTRCLKIHKRCVCEENQQAKPLFGSLNEILNGIAKYHFY